MKLSSVTNAKWLDTAKTTVACTVVFELTPATPAVAATATKPATAAVEATYSAPMAFTGTAANPELNGVEVWSTAVSTNPTAYVGPAQPPQFVTGSTATSVSSTTVAASTTAEADGTPATQRAV